ncbi:MAG: flagellar hook-basal body protein [Defluviitaleaceae bacterium]|nr:flagellar hook-basal body protein [Defluviitaleaceae bacterium]MCL2261836.1 flagellar hook-basal body protein [Defluviitaleaceae bacterium]
MMRSLWTSASGMTAQMLKIDTVTNNIANVNTTGFKRERVEFKTLLYETMQRTNLDPANMTGRPVNLQVGHGVRPAATTRIFTQGSFQRTDRPADFAIEGNAFFQIRTDFDEYFYTQDGSFHWMPLEDGTLMLTTSSGFPVMDVEGEEIILPEGITASDVTVSYEGMLYATIEGVFTDLEAQIRLVQFANPNGLQATGRNLFSETIASGEPLLEAEGEVNRLSRVVQGYLEMSNVNIAEEMIGIITAQRAFDTNSRGITTSNEMLQTATQLIR